jgi:hypothetical protein
MQKVEEKMILRILAQEPRNLELWLERYENLKFQELFHEFFSAMDLSGNIFQNPGV